MAEYKYQNSKFEDLVDKINEELDNYYESCDEKDKEYDEDIIIKVVKRNIKSFKVNQLQELLIEGVELYLENTGF